MGTAGEEMRGSFRSVYCSVVLFVVAASSGALAQGHEVKLWPGGAPGVYGAAAESSRVTPEGEHVLTHIGEPSITPYLPAAGTASGAAVIVAPGGGHREIWMDHEGYNVAQWLSAHGVAAFILKYRLAREAGSTYTVEGTELADIQRAIRVVRSRSAEWSVDPARVGVMGFSAGGELAALAATRFDGGVPAAADAVERISSKPAFEALLYPALPHDSRLTPETPPAFLACGANDRPDISQGLAEYYLALARLHVSAELHIYAGVGHGFGVRSSNQKPVADWPMLFLQWMRARGLVQP